MIRRVSPWRKGRAIRVCSLAVTRKRVVRTLIGGSWIAHNGWFHTKLVLVLLLLAFRGWCQVQNKIWRKPQSRHAGLLSGHERDAYRLAVPDSLARQDQAVLDLHG